MLHGTDKTIWQRQTQVKKIHKRITALEQSVKILEGLNKFQSTNLTLNSDVDQDK